MRLQKLQVPVNDKLYLQDLKGHVFAEFPASLGFWKMITWERGGKVRKFQFCRDAVFKKEYPVKVGEKKQYLLPGGALIITRKPLPEKFQLPENTFTKDRNVAILPSGAIAVNLTEEYVTWTFETYKRTEGDEQGWVHGLYWYDIDE